MTAGRWTRRLAPRGPAMSMGKEELAGLQSLEPDEDGARGGRSGGTNTNLTSNGHRLMMAKPRDLANARGFDWVKDKSEADRMSEKMTEWDEALIKHKIREDPRKAVREAEAQVAAAVQEAVDAYDPLAKKSLDQLDELEDDEDEAVLAEYRRRRIQEMKAARAAARFGSVLHIREDEYRQEVSDEAAADRETWVVVHLFKDTKTGCVLVNRCLDELAKRYPATKFVKIFATDANQDYPDSSLPTLLMYHKGEIAHQMIGMDVLGGPRVSTPLIEWRLAQAGAITGCELDEDPFEEI
eukprot:COSAG01_NODE_483_length_16412_cov_17.605162_6_plen_297_part_00